MSLGCDIVEYYLKLRRNAKEREIKIYFICKKKCLKFPNRRLVRKTRKEHLLPARALLHYSPNSRSAATVLASTCLLL